MQRINNRCPNKGTATPITEQWDVVMIDCLSEDKSYN